MLRLRRIAILISLSCAPVLLGTGVHSVSPDSGPAAGGTEVTIRGDFSGFGPFNVVFGSIPAPVFEKRDAQTIVAISPAHLPGESTVFVREGDEIFAPSFSTFTFEGDVPAAFERILIPILTPPVRGAFGSEFHATFTAWNASPSASVQLYGLERACIVCLLPPIPPEDLIDVPLLIFPESNIDGLFGPVIPSGSPGRFVFVPAEEANVLGTGLRVHDVSRATLNLGTEIPVVRSRELATTETLVLPNVPVDSRFRSTLRIYATGETNLRVTFLTGFGGFLRSERIVHLPAGRHLFEPAYALVSNFPEFLSNPPSPLTVTIAPLPTTGPAPQPAFWAFISVTNNETQAITAISPQR